MMQIPIIQLGQELSEPEEQLDYLSLPKQMSTFELPVFPEIDNLEDYPQTLACLQQLETLLDTAEESRVGVLPLDQLLAKDLLLLQELLGEGEVAIQFRDSGLPEIQETRLAGVWWVRQQQEERCLQWLEVASIPQAVTRHTFAEADWPQVALPEEAGYGNAAPVITELLAASLQMSKEAAASSGKVINLSLLPFTLEDHQLLAKHLGIGQTLILSRGYGNCRITSTATPWIWRVQYFNNTDQLILDSLEVIRVPDVACAAPEDIRDSADRLREIKELLYA